jgi:hypothetical protein
MDKHKLELHIQRELVEFLRARGWYVQRMLADSFQNGLPDLYCHHKKWGQRWVEVKRADGYSFTRRQRQKWPEFEQAGIGIWILTAATQEEYDRLFGPANWRDYYKGSFQVPDVHAIDAMLDELVREGEQQPPALA